MSEAVAGHEGDIVTKLSSRSVSHTVARFTDMVAVKGIEAFWRHRPEGGGPRSWPRVARDDVGPVR